MPPLVPDGVVYLDYNASTPCAREVIDVMLPFLRTHFGNASSVHVLGNIAAEAVDTARHHVASAIGALPDEVYFTSGATESNNAVLLGLEGELGKKRRVVVSSIEHKSVLEPTALLSEQGLDVVTLPVTKDGIADLQAAERLIDEHTLLVAIQYANNEVGTLQPVQAVSKIAHARQAFVLCDATQALGKVPVSVEDLEVDYASFSAHKVYGPKGIGALFVRRGLPRSMMRARIRGGGHEHSLRAGTLNVPGIVGFGEACRLLEEHLARDTRVIVALRSRFETAVLEALPNAWINGWRVERLPGTSSLTIPGVPGSMLMANTPRLCISDGSACAAGTPEPSHVLVAMGLSREDADCTVRVSFGRGCSSQDAEVAACSIIRAASAVISMMRERDVRESRQIGGHRL